MKKAKLLPSKFPVYRDGAIIDIVTVKKIDHITGYVYFKSANVAYLEMYTNKSPDLETLSFNENDLHFFNLN